MQLGGGLTDLMALAQVSQQMGLNDPPPIKDLLSLLGTAQTMQQQEQETAIKQQALEQERQKMNMLTPEMFNALMFNPQVAASPEAQRSLVNQARPGTLPPQPETPKETSLPTLGKPAAIPATGTKGQPKGRIPMKSQEPFYGYQPPNVGDVEAVLDENGNIINFVQKGTQSPVSNFVPTAQSIGGYGASKYALAHQMKVLGQYLGLTPMDQPTIPY